MDSNIGVGDAGMLRQWHFTAAVEHRAARARVAFNPRWRATYIDPDDVQPDTTAADAAALAVAMMAAADSTGHGGHTLAPDADSDVREGDNSCRIPAGWAATRPLAFFAFADDAGAPSTGGDGTARAAAQSHHRASLTKSVRFFYAPLPADFGLHDDAADPSSTDAQISSDGPASTSHPVVVDPADPEYRRLRAWCSRCVQHVLASDPQIKAIDGQTNLGDLKVGHKLHQAWSFFASQTPSFAFDVESRRTVDFIARPLYAHCVGTIVDGVGYMLLAECDDEAELDLYVQNALAPLCRDAKRLALGCVVIDAEPSGSHATSGAGSDGATGSAASRAILGSSNVLRSPAPTTGGSAMPFASISGSRPGSVIAPGALSGAAGPTLVPLARAKSVLSSNGGDVGDSSNHSAASAASGGVTAVLRPYSECDHPVLQRQQRLFGEFTYVDQDAAIAFRLPMHPMIMRPDHSPTLPPGLGSLCCLTLEIALFEKLNVADDEGNYGSSNASPSSSRRDALLGRQRENLHQVQHAVLFIDVEDVLRAGGLPPVLTVDSYAAAKAKLLTDTFKDARVIGQPLLVEVGTRRRVGRSTTCTFSTDVAGTPTVVKASSITTLVGGNGASLTYYTRLGQGHFDSHLYFLQHVLKTLTFLSQRDMAATFSRHHAAPIRLTEQDLAKAYLGADGTDEDEDDGGRNDAAGADDSGDGRRNSHPFGLPPPGDGDDFVAGAEPRDAHFGASYGSAFTRGSSDGVTLSGHNGTHRRSVVAGVRAEVVDVATRKAAMARHAAALRQHTDGEVEDIPDSEVLRVVPSADGTSYEVVTASQLHERVAAAEPWNAIGGAGPDDAAGGERNFATNATPTGKRALRPPAFAWATARRALSIRWQEEVVTLLAADPFADVLAPSFAARLLRAVPRDRTIIPAGFLPSVQARVAALEAQLPAAGVTAEADGSDSEEGTEATVTPASAVEATAANAPCEVKQPVNVGGDEVSAVDETQPGPVAIPSTTASAADRAVVDTGATAPAAANDAGNPTSSAANAAAVSTVAAAAEANGATAPSVIALGDPLRGGPTQAQLDEVNEVLNTLRFTDGLGGASSVNPTASAAEAATAEAESGLTSLRDHYARCCAEEQCRPNSFLMGRLPERPSFALAIEALDLSHNYVGHSGLIAILRLLFFLPRVRSVHFCDMSLDNSDAAAICEILASHPTLQALYLAQNPRITLPAARRFFRLLQANPRLTRLSLDGSGLGSDLQARLEALAATNGHGK